MPSSHAMPCSVRLPLTLQIWRARSYEEEPRRAALELAARRRREARAEAALARYRAERDQSSRANP